MFKRIEELNSPRLRKKCKKEYDQVVRDYEKTEYLYNKKLEEIENHNQQDDAFKSLVDEINSFYIRYSTFGIKLGRQNMV